MNQKICADCGTVGGGGVGAGCALAFVLGGAIVGLSLVAYLLLVRSFLVILAAVLLACVYAVQASTPKCAACGGKSLLPVDSPRGRKLVEDQGGQVIED